MIPYNPSCQYCHYNLSSWVFYCSKAKCECTKELCPERSWLCDVIDKSVEKWCKPVPVNGVFEPK